MVWNRIVDGRTHAIQSTGWCPNCRGTFKSLSRSSSAVNIGHALAHIQKKHKEVWEYYTFSIACIIHLHNVQLLYITSFAKCNYYIHSKSDDGDNWKNPPEIKQLLSPNTKKNNKIKKKAEKIKKSYDKYSSGPQSDLDGYNTTEESTKRTTTTTTTRTTTTIIEEEEQTEKIKQPKKEDEENKDNDNEEEKTEKIKPQKEDEQNKDKDNENLAPIEPDQNEDKDNENLALIEPDQNEDKDNENLAPIEPNENEVISAQDQKENEQKKDNENKNLAQIEPNKTKQVTKQTEGIKSRPPQIKENNEEMITVSMFCDSDSEFKQNKPTPPQNDMDVDSECSASPTTSTTASMQPSPSPGPNQIIQTLVTPEPKTQMALYSNKESRCYRQKLEHVRDILKTNKPKQRKLTWMNKEKKEEKDQEHNDKKKKKKKNKNKNKNKEEQQQSKTKTNNAEPKRRRKKKKKKKTNKEEQQQREAFNNLEDVDNFVKSRHLNNAQPRSSSNNRKTWSVKNHSPQRNPRGGYKTRSYRHGKRKRENDDYINSPKQKKPKQSNNNNNNNNNDDELFQLVGHYNLCKFNLMIKRTGPANKERWCDQCGIQIPASKQRYTCIGPIGQKCDKDYCNRCGGKRIRQYS